MRNDIKSKINKKILSPQKLAFIILITMMIVNTLSLSRYKSTTAGTSSTKIALLANDVSFSIEDTVKGYPGELNRIYPIIISNKKDEKICEVSQKYTISINKLESPNLPLEIALYKDSICTVKLNPNDDGTIVDESFEFSAGTEDTKTYYLKVSWPSDRNSEEYSTEIEYFNIDITINQVD